MGDETVHALDGVSFSVQRGGYCAIVGPSGSGKSTLLRMLLGLEAPESGSIYYDGRDLAMLDVQKLRRRGRGPGTPPDTVEAAAGLAPSSSDPLVEPRNG